MLFKSVAAAAGLLAMLPTAMAGFNPGSNKNIAVYWGQNSYNQGTGPLAQQRLGTYCANTDISIIPLAFMNGISPPITNFANAGDNCTAFPDNGNVLSCPQIEEDIKTCQSKYGKTIFYNNWCGVSNFQPGAGTQNAYNFDVWDKWAKGSKNPGVKLLLGIPAAQGAGGGYTKGAKLKAAINYSQKFSSFGGVMMWDMSQLYSNSGFLSEVLADIAGGPTTTTPPTTTTTSSPGTTPPTSTSSPPPSGGGLDQYAQCGGNGYNGPTVCKAPWKCVKQSEWWSACN
ncbi:hypothetical protein LLEC1_04885 [Akanthomyces lecanii]|uniref:CBM1 domain-containing protein n=1 Tax=Cordyceps confragosa TaxID=2714763 RepID=A0A179ICI1_CORDF|nr:hypothetical protein LLEC1_04885 [Akanthomyces lecanii]